MNKTFPTLCGSVSANPSRMGFTMHTIGYKTLGLDYQYVAIGATEIELVVQSIRTLSFRGLGVSMPHKQTIIPLLDEIGPDVQAIGACNTVVQEDGRLRGYNTDWVGALGALDEIENSKDLRKAVIIGSGGVARAIAYALKQRGMAVYISARTAEAREQLVNDLQLDGAGALEQQGQFGAELIVNSTPESNSASWPTNLEAHTSGRVLFDVVFRHRRTQLTAEAEHRGWSVVPGWRMLLHQAMGQFKLYTGQDAPMSAFEKALQEVLPD